MGFDRFSDRGSRATEAIEASTKTADSEAFIGCATGGGETLAIGGIGAFVFVLKLFKRGALAQGSVLIVLGVAYGDQ